MNIKTLKCPLLLWSATKDTKMSTSVVFSNNKEANYKAKYGAFCGHHNPKDQVTPVVKKAKVAKAPKRSLPKLNASRANQLIKENNIFLRAIADKIGLDVEEALCPVINKYSPTYDDEDLEPEEEGEDEELLNWNKKTKEVKEITPEVSVELVTPKVELFTPEASVEEVELVTPEASVEEVVNLLLFKHLQRKRRSNQSQRKRRLNQLQRKRTIIIMYCSSQLEL